jgi:hypothetical protein
MRSRVLRSCRPLRARPTLGAHRQAGQRGYPRTPCVTPRARPRLVDDCGQPVEKVGHHDDASLRPTRTRGPIARRDRGASAPASPGDVLHRATNRTRPPTPGGRDGNLAGSWSDLLVTTARTRENGLRCGPGQPLTQPSRPTRASKGLRSPRCVRFVLLSRTTARPSRTADARPRTADARPRTAGDASIGRSSADASRPWRTSRSWGASMSRPTAVPSSDRRAAPRSSR